MDKKLLNSTYTYLSEFERARLNKQQKVHRTSSTIHCTRKRMSTGSLMVNFARNEDKGRFHTKSGNVKRYQNYPYALGTPIPVEDRMKKSSTASKFHPGRKRLTDSQLEVRDFLSSSQKIPDYLKKEMFMRSLQNPKMRSVKLVKHTPKHRDVNYIRK